MTARIGSLFSGGGGLDRAVEAVFGGETVWHSEVDPAASKVLAHRWPGVPNLGDITAIDWTAVQPIDILCGGFPCQDLSAAGKRAGLKTGTRSGLWAYYAEAIDTLRPEHVVIENVRGLLSGRAHRDMERCDPIVGDNPDGFVLRAAGAVLGDLADIGYDTCWATVSAASVGAPHRRERVFIFAVDAERGRCDSGEPWQTIEGESSSYVGGSTTSDTSGDGRHERRPEPARLVGGSDAALGGAGPVNLLPTPQSFDGVGSGYRSRKFSEKQDAKLLGGVVKELFDLLPTPCAQQSGNTPENHLAKKPGRTVVTDLAILVENGLLESGGALLPTPRTTDGNGAGVHGTGGQDLRTTITLLQTPSSADGGGGHLNRSGDRKNEQLLAGQAREMATQWGKYGPAIARWEALTRAAPSPTEPNTKGNPRLNPAFSEWMLGWPDGWVTGVPGISRNDQLRIVGNGVCPQQAIAALRWLLAVSEMAA